MPPLDGAEHAPNGLPDRARASKWVPAVGECGPKCSPVLSSAKAKTVMWPTRER